MTLVPLPEKLIKELMSFGLSGNEAKVYLALLQLKKANARVIAKLSNIPRRARARWARDICWNFRRERSGKRSFERRRARSTRADYCLSLRG